LRPRQAVRLLQYRDGDDILFDRHYQNLVRGVEREARERHLDIVLSSCLECEQDLDHVLASRCESGLVLYGEFENGFAGRVARRGVPAVAIDDAANGHDSLDTVRVDYFRAAYDATKHLIDLGHRTIAYMGGSRMCDRGDIKEWKASVLRRDGFLQAMADASLQVLEDHVRVEFGTQRHALRGARRLFDRIHKPTAVVCFSPSIALGVELAATEKGLDIPRDLSLLTFSECEQVYFRGDSNFTTVWADAYEAGRTSLRLLQARIQNPTRPPQTVTIPSQLYPGDTCAKPASR
jgi:LacI family transcriptional regulator